MTERRLFGICEAARYVAHSPSFIKKAIKKRHLRAYKYRDPDTGKLTKKLVIEGEDLMNWWDAHKEEVRYD